MGRPPNLDSVAVQTSSIGARDKVALGDRTEYSASRRIKQKCVVNNDE